MTKEQLNEVKRVFEQVHYSSAIRSLECKNKTFEECRYPSCIRRRAMLSELEGQVFKHELEEAAKRTRSALFRSRFYRWFAERNTLGDQCKHPDVPRDGIMIMKLQDYTYDEKQTSEHDSLLTDLV